jgi:hypothetical protein
MNKESIRNINQGRNATDQDIFQDYHHGSTFYITLKLLGGGKKKKKIEDELEKVEGKILDEVRKANRLQKSIVGNMPEEERKKHYWNEVNRIWGNLNYIENEIKELLKEKHFAQTMAGGHRKNKLHKGKERK